MRTYHFVLKCRSWWEGRVRLTRDHCFQHNLMPVNKGKIEGASFIGCVFHLCTCEYDTKAQPFLGCCSQPSQDRGGWSLTVLWTQCNRTRQRTGPGPGPDNHHTPNSCGPKISGPCSNLPGLQAGWNLVLHQTMTSSSS